MAHASDPRPVRLAFVGQATYFEACIMSPGDSPIETRFYEYRAGGDTDALVRGLREYRPDVTIVFRPEVLPPGALREVDTIALGFLTEPLPRQATGEPVHHDLETRFWELSHVDPGNFDRIVSFDPYIARTAEQVVPVWRSLPIPVANRYYRPVTERPVRRQAVFVGRSTEHREGVLEESKHRHDVLHIAFGAGADHLERLMGEHDVAINIHNEPYPSFENRVCLHLAAGHLVLSEPLDPLHGLEPGIDFVPFDGSDQLAEALAALRDNPFLWHAVRVRGRRKAETYRASRVWPRLVGDLLRDVAAFGRCRPSQSSSKTSR